jgi:hypothetical protein
MCQKTAFLTLQEAQRALRAPMRSVRAWTTKVPCRAYECQQCRLFHLTSQPLPQKVTA